MMKSLLAASLIAIPLIGSAAEPPEGKLDEALRQELKTRVKKDQDARRDYIKWVQEHPQNGAMSFWQRFVWASANEIDRTNRAWLKDVIEKCGWPGKSLVGEDGMHNVWLLVQHADLDREFQKKCLELMKVAAAKGEASKSDLAYLTDRVLVGEHKKQIYGTQFEQVNGKLEPNAIEDDANVDQRRKEVGLPSMAEYRKMIDQTYGAKKK